LCFPPRSRVISQRATLLLRQVFEPPGGFKYLSPTKAARGASILPWIRTPAWLESNCHVKNSYDPRPRNACPRVLSENVSLPTRNTTRVKRGDQNGPTLTRAVEHSRNTRGSSLSTRRECLHSDHRRLASASSTWTVPMAPWLRATTAATRVRVARSIRFVLVTSPRPRTGFAGDSHFKRLPRGAQAAQVAGSALRETARGPMGPCTIATRVLSDVRRGGV